MSLNNWLNNSLEANDRLSRAETNLRKYVSRLDKQQVMLAFWEVQRLQTGDDKTPSRIRGLPQGGLGKSIAEGKPYFFPWMIEQSINIISIFGSDHNHRGQNIDVFQWSNLAQLYNLVRNYNDARSGVFLKTNDVFENMSKIGRQQFPWQDGSLGTPMMEMYATLYLGQACNQACQSKYQISANDFLAYGFLLLAQFNSAPFLQLPYDLSILGGEQDVLKVVLKRYSLSSRDFNQGCRTLRKNDKFGEYSKSQLRKKPIIRLADGKYFCPMPKLLQFRITSGLISETSYDGNAINEVGDNFEKFSFEKFTQAFPDETSKSEEVYGTKNRSKKTPDIRIYKDDSLDLIIECKATLLLFEDKFEKVNLESLPKKSEQIIKGILQVWRYSRDSHKGVTPDKNISNDCKGLVLTLEEWIVLDEGRHQLLLSKAHKLADAEGIPEFARIKTTITSIKDFLYILEHATLEEFLECLEAALNPKFNGYVLQSIFRETHKDKVRIRDLFSEEVLNQKIWYWRDVRVSMP